MPWPIDRRLAEHFSVLAQQHKAVCERRYDIFRGIAEVERFTQLLLGTCDIACVKQGSAEQEARFGRLRPFFQGVLELNHRRFFFILSEVAFS